MKILLATSTFELNGGGISSYAHEFVHAYKMEHEIVLLTDELCEDGFCEGMRVFSAQGDDGWKIFERCQAVLAMIEAGHFDVIVNSNSKIISVASPFIDVPIVTISHFVKGKLAVVAGYNSSYVSRIVALSDYGKRFLERKFGIRSAEKVVTVYNYVGTGGDIANASKPYGKRMVIVYPGGVALQKSPDVVCRALMELLKTNYDFKFYWLGRLKMPIAKLSLVKTMNQLFEVDERVCFTGFVKREELLKIMKNADLFILPSRGEGCPISLLEAMQCGCIPIVSDAKHASVELVNEGHFGFVVRQGSYKDLVKKLEYLFSHRDECERLRGGARHYLDDKLSEEKWKMHMNTLFNEAAKVEKKVKSCTPWNFHKSKLGLQLLLYVELLKAKLLSLRFFLYFNWLYVRKLVVGAKVC